jgi:hypothetical protein
VRSILVFEAAIDNAMTLLEASKIVLVNGSIGRVYSQQRACFFLHPIETKKKNAL